MNSLTHRLFFVNAFYDFMFALAVVALGAWLFGAYHGLAIAHIRLRRGDPDAYRSHRKMLVRAVAVFFGAGVSFFALGFTVYNLTGWYVASHPASDKPSKNAN